MQLERVTITGIDDQVDQSWIEEMTAAYPIVEWGVLFSDSRKGKPRYPTDQWVAELTDRFQSKTGVFLPGFDGHFSAHLCGDLCDRLIADAGKSYSDGKLIECTRPWFFRRIQLNSFADNERWDFTHINALASNLSHGAEIIIPVTDERVMNRVRYHFHQNVNFLHDPSRGKGIRTEEWSNLWHSEHFVGFAGGIGPDNVEDVLTNLCAQSGDRWFWIDMETRVRTDEDRLDPVMVEQVLRSASKFLEG